MRHPQRDESAEEEPNTAVCPRLFRWEFSIDAALHDIDNVVRVGMRENVVVRFPRRVFAEARVRVRDADRMVGSIFPSRVQLIGDQVETPAAMTETTMRIVPDVLAIVTVQHGKTPAVIVLREFGKIHVNRPGIR